MIWDKSALPVCLIQHAVLFPRKACREKADWSVGWYGEAPGDTVQFILEAEAEIPEQFHI